MLLEYTVDFSKTETSVVLITFMKVVIKIAIKIILVCELLIHLM